MSATTERVLERVLVLLAAHPPHLATARKQLDELIAKPPCEDETAAARKMVLRLWDHLVQPVLAGHPETRIVAEGVRERLQENGSLTGTRGSLDKLANWIARPPTPQTGREALPSTLSGRLLTALRLYGESLPAVGTEATRLLNQTGHEPNWHEIEQLLDQVITRTEPMPPTLLEQEQEHLRQIVTDGMQRLNRVREVMPESEDLALWLRQRGREAKQRARSLAGRIEDSKIMAERLKKRLRQLEEAVGQARIEGFMDPVTGLPDRFAFTAQLKRHLERAMHLREPFSLALLHFEDLAAVAKKLGGEREARLLDGVVGQMRRFLRDDEYLARLSVERLVILFPRADQSRAETAIRDISNMLAETRFLVDDQGIDLEAQCGTVALGPEMSGQEMVELTDRLAAAAKQERGPREPRMHAARICAC
ncbi:MAG: GGDEF domain-containing protein [Magnetococcales bacterium]|nr:GGDEF domain-containing protein [Magnetococcales bacterium]NGZ05764.1 GGDEF domain-containing protein [Magnetococcales bacterium]